MSLIHEVFFGFFVWTIIRTGIRIALLLHTINSRKILGRAIAQNFGRKSFFWSHSYSNTIATQQKNIHGVQEMQDIDIDNDNIHVFIVLETSGTKWTRS